MQRIGNGAPGNNKSSVNREAIVDCTKRDKANWKREEKEKFPTPTKPAQSPAPPSLPTYPHFTQEGRKWGKHPGISSQVKELRAQKEGGK